MESLPPPNSKPEDTRQMFLGRIRMGWILFWVFVVIFIAIVAGMFHIMFVKGEPTAEERRALFTLFIAAVGSGVMALFYNIFNLRQEKAMLLPPKQKQEHTTDGKQAVFQKSDENKHRFELSRQPERIFTCLAVIFASLSAIITVGDMFTSDAPSWVPALNNFLIFIVLLILTLFFFLRYRQVLADYALQGESYRDNFDMLNRLISEQSGFYHAVMRDTRHTFHTQFGSDIYPFRFSYKNPRLKEIMENSVHKVVAVLVRMILNNFQMRNLEEKVSLSVKVQVTGKMARSICKMDDAARTKLSPNGEYIITLARDHETSTLLTEREVRKEAYTIADNTDFNHIRAGAPEFVSNDLLKLEKEGQYTNNNPRWKEWYNATMIVPITHKASANGEPMIYGFLTVDSPNTGRRELFTRDGVRPILAFGADLLALIFLNLEMFDKPAAGPEEVASNTSDPKSDGNQTPNA